MEIKGTGRVDGSRVAATSSAQFKITDAAAETRALVVSGPGPIAALDSILTLQAMDDSTDGRSKGMAHGEQLLDMLDQVRDGLLAGGIPRTTLNRLANAVSRRPGRQRTALFFYRMGENRVAGPAVSRAGDDGMD